ncbi:AraC family transcriptional regulator [Cytophagaceae bacterium DM2B3-1]|uniref:AraC family transcriptional regulator n=1 Tax=Xanthocytophaga flava TaxID=3048013 RepID=A0ABT7CX20_9BACT|nr:AraC family transcriptional regulator [Xanthocytophaga flavus]MDJ1469261.1 AraC family transcriptional regulator [Xanthocytophaga flavus]MDJ1497482.1 AraC family transcriptional regulator [Xanthocytophaga flavus]
MRVVISGSDNRVISETESISENDLSFQAYSKLKYSSNESFWKSSAHEIRYNGTHIARHTVNVLEDISLQTFDAPNVVSLFFVEKGIIQSESYTGDRWEIGALQHNLIYNSYNTTETLFKKQTDLRLTIVSFAPRYFMEMSDGGGKVMDKIASTVAGGQSFVLGSASNLRLNLQMLQLLQSLGQTGYNTAVERLLTESKVLELLALQIGQLHKEETLIHGKKLSAMDIKKLHDVRDILLSDLSANFTLHSLSHQVGLNVYKLKFGFKFLFGQPVFNYLKEARLTYAAQQLALETKSITQIAYEAGFATPSHFSDAFKKFYGVSPNKFR